MLNLRYILYGLLCCLLCSYIKLAAQVSATDSSKVHPSGPVVATAALKDSTRVHYAIADTQRMHLRDMAGRKDTVKAPRPLTAAELQKLYPPDIINTLVYDFFATANGIYYENARNTDQINEFNFQYNVTINNTLQIKKYTFRFYFYNEYSLRYIVDSITTKGLDALQVRYGLQRQIKKNVNVQGNFAVKSQVWPTYQYRPSATGDYTEKYLYSDYFSPGYITYNVGLSYIFLDNATVNFGLAGGRTTKIRNKDIFRERKATRLYGLDTGNLRYTTYGLSLQLGVPPQMLNKHFGWECNASLYADRKQLGRLAGYSFDVQNTFHYVFFKHFRFSLKSSLQYDELINNKVFMMNALLVGFYLSNRI